jgi:hypothetical protein
MYVYQGAEIPDASLPNLIFDLIETRQEASLGDIYAYISHSRAAADTLISAYIAMLNGAAGTQRLWAINMLGVLKASQAGAPLTELFQREFPQEVLNELTLAIDTESSKVKCLLLVNVVCALISIDRARFFGLACSICDKFDGSWVGEWLTAVIARDPSIGKA